MKIKLTEREIDIIYQYKERVENITNNKIQLSFRQAITHLFNSVKNKLDDTELWEK